MTYADATESMNRLARLVRTAGPLPDSVKYKLQVLENTTEAIPDPNPGSLRALNLSAKRIIEDIERYLATQPGVIYPTPADDPPMAHPSWSRSLSASPPV